MNQHTAFALGVLFGHPQRREAALTYFRYTDLRWLHWHIPFDKWLGEEYRYEVDTVFDPKQIEWAEIIHIAENILDSEDEQAEWEEADYAE